MTDPALAATALQELTDLPAHIATQRIQQGDLTVSELCEALLARVKTRLDIGAWTYLDEELVKQEAKKLDEKPLEARE